MKTEKINKAQTLRYRIYASAGRWLYTVRLRLEGLNDYLDRQAGKYWLED
jgi:hypothetical protein